MSEDTPLIVSPTREIGVTAGIVKTPGIDDVLLAIESEEDIVNANQRLVEGVPQTAEQMDLWQWLLTELMRLCNQRLSSHEVFLAGAQAHPNGIGATFAGVDRDEHVYTVTLVFPPKQRDDLNNASKESFIRWAIDQIVGAVLEEKRRYYHRAGYS